MSEINLDKRMKFGYFLMACLVFIVIALRNAVVPFCHDEMATFVMYVQNGEFWPYHAIVDANNHFLNSGLSHICFKLFGPSLFSLRLPNLGAFVILVFVVYRLLLHLRTNVARYSLIALFLVSFNFLSFYSTCRGYGMSMTLLLASFLLMLEYFKSGKRWLFYGFLLSIQLAISANLTLIILSVMLTCIILFYQVIQNKLKDIWIVPGYLLHFVSLYLWVDFSFFLQEGNALYYGQGDSYWEITFVTLIELITGWININFDYLIAILVGVTFFSSVVLLVKKNIWSRFKQLDSLLIFTVLLLGSFVAFFVLHIWKDINYPEDRTGLFFYPLFVLMFVFLIDNLEKEKIRKFLLVIPVLMAIHFLLLLNFKNHAISEYETFPERFYTTLEKAQENSKDKLSISGHRLNELMFAYFNYRHDGKLNPVDDSEEFNIYSDYGITKKEDNNRYKNYYDVIGEDDWDFVLLKRKNQCKRVLVHTVKSDTWYEGTDEYHDFLRLNDTSLHANSPLLFEMNFDIDHAAQPLNAWLVLDVKDEKGNPLIYKRAAFNWMNFSWNGKKNNTLLLITDKMPSKIQSLVIYLWSNKKQFVKIIMNQINIYRLE